MKTPAPINFLPVIWLLFSINASMAQPLDSQAIKAIDLQITPQPLAHLGFSNAKAFHEAVIGNLSQWRFPLHAENGQTYTHTMTVDIGEIKNAETPVGFSFSSGNSDPRAQGFQKANVIPIQCRLNDNANPEQEEQLEMTFSAPSASGNSQKFQETLTDNISSVCFDLLDSLKFLPPPTATETASAISKPTWMPSVQVETVPIPQSQPTAETPPAATSPAVPAASAAAAAKTSATPVTTKPAATPPATEPQETRKQLIIHNQGTPVIIKFGYDRR